MVVDAHLHLNYRGLTPERLVAYLDREGIEQGWTLTWEELQPSRNEVLALPVEEVLAAHARYPTRIIPFYAPDPRRPDAAARLTELHEKGIRGCGELKVTLRWDEAPVGELLHAAESLNMPVVFHMEEARSAYAPISDSRVERWIAKALNSDRFLGLPRRGVTTLQFIHPGWRRRIAEMQYRFPGYLLDFAALEERLREFPRLRFVGHGPGFWKGISGRAANERGTHPRTRVAPDGIVDRLLSEYDNLFADLSGRSGYNALARDLRHARQFLERHHRKLLFGTDNFALGLRRLIGAVELPTDRLTRIMGTNAHEVLTGVRRD